MIDTARVPVEAEIFKHRGTVRRTIRFDTLNLRFAEDNRWQGAVWEFTLEGALTRLPAEPIEEITATSGRFNISVIDGQGQSAGPFSVQAAMSGYPCHSYCFLFSVEKDDFWSGHTVARSFGKIAIVPYRFDPT